MARRKFPRNSACPCGSGRKYKNCCYGKDFDWIVDDERNVSRTFPISDEVADVLQEARKDFIEKNGREPNPDELVFPDMPPLEHIEHQMVQAMTKAGVDPAFIYAFEKTGLFVTEANMNLIPEKDRKRLDNC